jgi:hypothetical protein
MKKAIILLGVLGLFTLTEGRNLSSNNDLPHILTNPDTQIRVHRASNIYFTVTNFGFWGSMDGQFTDPEFPWITAPGIEYPKESDNNYLFMGAIWIGATIDTIDSQSNPKLDTLVSVGNDGWWASVFELNPPYPGTTSIWRDRIDADEEIFSFCSDTITNPSIVSPDPNDNRPHIPLGIVLHQHSRAWSSPGYDEVFTIEYAIENIYNRDLHDVWLAVYYDGDVYNSIENPYGQEQGAQDDLCGSIERGNSLIAWLADNDGQPYSRVYNDSSCRDVMGVTLIKSSQPNIETNFNWWMSNIGSDRDWGPQWQSNYDIWGNFPGGGRGTPGGDRAKYQVMSNGERDYDQAYCDIDYTGDGWIPKLDGSADISNGYDTRYLISFGPLQIAANSAETLTLALCGGKNLHTDPQNYFWHLQYSSYDTQFINEYYRNLHFEDLLAKIDTAESIVNNNYAEVPAGPPLNFRMTSWSENQTSLAWSPSWNPNLQEYRIYRGTVSGIYDLNPITQPNFRDTVFTDYNVVDSVIYYYVITTVKESGIEGGYSPEVSVISGQPQTPIGLTATRGNGQVVLNWPQGPDDDIARYNIYSAVHGREMEFYDSTPARTYTDINLQNGMTYDYAIQAVDIYGNSSDISDIVSATPMGLDQGIIVIDANRHDQYVPDYDSMTAYYVSVFDPYQYTIIFDWPRNLTELANFSTVVWMKESPLTTFSLLYGPIQTVLSQYLDNGGNLIVTGTRNLVDQTNFEGHADFQSNDFRNRYLGISGIDFPGLMYNTEFIGGRSQIDVLTDFSLDTTKTNRIVFPTGEHDGRLFGIGTIVPNDSSGVIYSFNAVNPDSSNLHGRPIGIINITPTFKTATLEFPPFYVAWPHSYQIIWWLLDLFGEQSGITDITPELPKELKLNQNYPNPFNSTTRLSLDLPQPGDIKVSIYNLLGQEVAVLFDGYHEAGVVSLSWDAKELPSGAYFARLQTADKTQTVKMSLVK